MHRHHPPLASRSQRRSLAVPALGGVGLGTLALVLVSPGLVAQEALRVAEETTKTEARFKELTETPGSFPMRIGPVRFTANAGLRVEYTDNAHMSKDGGDDFIITPSLGLGLYWPIAEELTLNVGASVGYAIYCNNSDYNRFTMAGGPATALGFNFTAGGVRFNIHERAALSMSTYEDSTAYNAGGYTSFNNTAGIGAAYDMGKLKANAGYDHVNDIGLDNKSLAGDRQSDLLNASLPYLLRPTLTIGPTASTSWSSYSGGLSTDSFQWSAGGTIDWKLSDHAGINFGVGYTVYEFDGSGQSVPGVFEPTDSGSSDGIYFNFSWRHKPNQYLGYTATVGHSITGDYYGGAYETFNAGLSAMWNVIREVGITTAFNYTHGEGIAGYTQVYDYYSAGIYFSRGLARHLSATLSYSFYYRDTEDQTVGDYTSNVVALSLLYTF